MSTAILSPHILASTTERVLGQLRHDKRTLALIVVVPALLLTLIYYVFDHRPQVFNHVGLIMLGIFPFVLMFLITSIAMLRERTSGTLERLLSTPLAKLDLLFGYALAFGLVAAIQAIVLTAVAYWAFNLTIAGSVWLVVLVAVADAVLGMALGLLASAFARTEFQAVQFMPAIVFPQLFLCGLFTPRAEMAGWLDAISKALPLTYAVQALEEIGAHPNPTAILWRDLCIIVGAAIVALALAAATLRRRTD
ncbi:MAG TPA: ABC transporter permease [Micromonosporaceae bacterium]|jgi:ABC-2 type transport system permease protein